MRHCFWGFIKLATAAAAAPVCGKSSKKKKKKNSKNRKQLLHVAAKTCAYLKSNASCWTLTTFEHASELGFCLRIDFLKAASPSSFDCCQTLYISLPVLLLTEARKCKIEAEPINIILRAFLISLTSRFDIAIAFYIYAINSFLCLTLRFDISMIFGALYQNIIAIYAI